MGTDFKMFPNLTNLFLLLPALLLLSLAKVEGKECCEEKQVGSVNYTLLPYDHHLLPLACLDNCVYTVANTSTPKYCFQQGDLPTECLSDTTTTTTTTTTATTTTTTTTTTSPPAPGILVIGGFGATQSVEFWSASDQGPGLSCVLNDYPREIWPTVNLVSGRLVACYNDTCEMYKEGSWEYLQNTTVSRYYHSSVTREDAILLIGGFQSPKTTEWIPVNGSAAQQEPFLVRHGQAHCTIRISDDLIVVTGGDNARYWVTQYQLPDGTETPLTSMGTPRWQHACGVYRDADNQQVLLVTGGMGLGSWNPALSSTEVMTWGTGDVETFWRESSQLPAARIALRATTVNDIIYLTGGEDEAWNAFTSILSWDPLTESWNEAGNLKMGRAYHAAVAITSSIIESECSA